MQKPSLSVMFSLISLFFISGCVVVAATMVENDEVLLVRHGFTKYSKDLTIGEAFDAYSHIGDIITWDVLDEEGKDKMVKTTVPYKVEDVESFCSKCTAAGLGFDGMRYEVFFKIIEKDDEDDTFALSSAYFVPECALDEKEGRIRDSGFEGLKRIYADLSIKGSPVLKSVCSGYK